MKSFLVRTECTRVRKIKVHINDCFQASKAATDKDNAAVKATDKCKNRIVNNGSSFFQRATRTGPSVQCGGVGERTVSLAFCLSRVMLFQSAEAGVRPDLWRPLLVINCPFNGKHKCAATDQ